MKVHPDLIELGKRVEELTISDSALRTVLIEGGSIIGQAGACGFDEPRLLRMMTAQSAIVEALSNNRPEIMALRDEIIFAAMKAQHGGYGVSKEESFKSAEMFEKTLNEKGLALPPEQK